MEAHTSDRVRVAIGRASDFFGPRVLTSVAGEQIFGRAVEGNRAASPGALQPALRETIEMLYEFEESFVVDASDFARTFGDHATLLGAAIQETVRWYRERHRT